MKNFVKIPSMTPNFAFPCLSFVFVFVFLKTGVLSMYMGKPEIADGKSNGSRHSVWEASGSMGYDSRRCNFLLFLVCSTDLDILCSGLIMPNFHPGGCVNGEHLMFTLYM